MNKASVISNIGRKRRENQDNFYVNGKIIDRTTIGAEVSFGELSELGHQLFGVFDGMGGEEYGCEASYIAAYTLRKYQEVLNRKNMSGSSDYFETYIKDVNGKISDIILSNQLKGMGTTAAIVYIYGNTARVINIGDSRVYRIRNDEIIQLSEDHTQVQAMVRNGILTKEEAAKHPRRNLLSQHLGILTTDFVIQPMISDEIELLTGDRFVVCSDGLTETMPDEEILTLSKGRSPYTLTVELISKTLSRDSKDNITVLVVDYLE